MKKSQLWNQFTTYPLYNNEIFPDQHWRQILLKLRSGTYGNSDDGSAQFPEHMIQESDSANELQKYLIEFIYNDIDHNYHNTDWL